MFNLPLKVRITSKLDQVAQGLVLPTFEDFET